MKLTSMRPGQYVLHIQDNRYYFACLKYVVNPSWSLPTNHKLSWPIKQPWIVGFKKCSTLRSRTRRVLAARTLVEAKKLAICHWIGNRISFVPNYLSMAIFAGKDSVAPSAVADWCEENDQLSHLEDMVLDGVYAGIDWPEGWQPVVEKFVKFIDIV